MIAIGLPVLATVALWWLSTGALLYVDGLNRRTFGASFAAATALAGIAIYGVAASRTQATAAGALEAFACGLTLWGWQLASFYLGFITGPRKTPCEPSLTGWRRFIEAARTGLYHELASLAGAVVIAALIWRHANAMALWTYGLLWVMHLSAKLNIYLGVGNLGEELLPEHLRFLQSFMTRKPMNLLFPISVTLATAGVVLLAQEALAASATPFETASAASLATLMVLAIIEHWFLVAPVRGNALWQWGLQPAQKAAQPTSPHVGAIGLPIVEIAAISEDSDYARPMASAESALESWSAHPPALCDARGLRQVLDSISGGRFGDVACVKGVVQTSASWIRFEVEGARSSIATFAPQRRPEPLVIAFGRGVDRVRLQAAFDGCSV